LEYLIQKSGKFLLRYHITSEFGCLQSKVIEVEVRNRQNVEIDYKVENCDELVVCFEINGEFEGGVLWDFGIPGSNTDTSSLEKPCFTFPEMGTYQIRLTNLIDFCSFEPTIITLQLNKLDDVIEVDSASACLRDTVVLSVNESNINLTYKWTNETGNILSESSTFRLVVTKNEKIFVTATDENGCEFKDSVLITGINEFPDLVYLSPFPVCVGDTVNFPMVNANPNHIISILWDESPRIVGRRDTLNPMIGIPSDVMSPFSIAFTARTQFGCILRDTIDFIAGQPPVVDFTFEVEDCDNFRVCFTATGEIQGFPFWDFGDTTTTDDVSVQREVCYTYPGAGTYRVELTNRTNFCAFKPVVKFITLNKDLTFFDVDTIEGCKNEITNIAVPPRAQGLRFEWLDINGNILSTTNPLQIRADTTKSIILSVLDQNNCPFRDTIVLVPFEFDYELIVPELFCLDTEIEAEIIIKNEGINFTYQWLPLDCIVSGQGTAKVTIDVSETKDVIVIVTHPTIGCTLRDTFNIEPRRVIVTVAAQPDTVIRLLNSTDIFVSNPQPGWTYLWSNGSTNVRQTVSPSETTTYTVTVTDQEGCTGTAQITITVIPPDCEEDVFIPNAFSPNGDRANDVLLVRSNYIDEMELIIYNRWGREVFKSTDQNTGWDGTFNGATLAPDAFAYFLKVRCIDGTEIRRQGNVSLLK
jgi:gliding motility-associated-like protein